MLLFFPQTVHVNRLEARISGCKLTKLSSDTMTVPRPAIGKGSSLLLQDNCLHLLEITAQLWN